MRTLAQIFVFTVVAFAITLLLVSDDRPTMLIAGDRVALSTQGNEHFQRLQEDYNVKWVAHRQADARCMLAHHLPGESADVLILLVGWDEQWHRFREATVHDVSVIHQRGDFSKIIWVDPYDYPEGEEYYYEYNRPNRKDPTGRERSYPNDAGLQYLYYRLLELLEDHA